MLAFVRAHGFFGDVLAMLIPFSPFTPLTRTVKGGDQLKYVIAIRVVLCTRKIIFVKGDSGEVYMVVTAPMGR